MITRDEILAVIPARSGSKGIKNKNLIKINKYSLLERAIRTAKQTNCFNKILVSTDSQKYAEIAIKAGAEILELRPKKLSGDKTTLALVLKDLLIKLKKQDKFYKNIISIQPTSPFLQYKTLQKAVNLFFK